MGLLNTVPLFTCMHSFPFLYTVSVGVDGMTDVVRSCSFEYRQKVVPCLETPSCSSLPPAPPRPAPYFTLVFCLTGCVCTGWSAWLRISVETSPVHWSLCVCSKEAISSLVTFSTLSSPTTPLRVSEVNSIIVIILTHDISDVHLQHKGCTVHCDKWH